MWHDVETDLEQTTDKTWRQTWRGVETDLEDVESFKLDVATFLLEHVHHQFQVVGAADVACHDGEVMTIQQQLT